VVNGRQSEAKVSCRGRICAPTILSSSAQIKPRDAVLKQNFQSERGDLKQFGNQHNRGIHQRHIANLATPITAFFTAPEAPSGFETGSVEP
jgi:hypothetical protein